jgi:hypothetical protein
MLRFLAPMTQLNSKLERLLSQRPFSTLRKSCDVCHRRPRLRVCSQLFDIRLGVFAAYGLSCLGRLLFCFFRQLLFPGFVSGLTTTNALRRNLHLLPERDAQEIWSWHFIVARGSVSIWRNRYATWRCPPEISRVVGVSLPCSVVWVSPPWFSDFRSGFTPLVAPGFAVKGVVPNQFALSTVGFTGSS